MASELYEVREHEKVELNDAQLAQVRSGGLEAYFLSYLAISFHIQPFIFVLHLKSIITGRGELMEEKRYLISDAAKVAQVEPHVLRYWEEELELPIQRTELGHRYYTEEDILTFQNIKELKERGLQLKAIKVLLPELKKRPSRNAAALHQLAAEKKEESEKEEENIAAEDTTVTLIPMDPSLDKLSRFEGIMTNIFKQTLKDNNEELENRISDAVLKGMDVLLQIREEKEEERYRRLDESIRSHQKKGKMVAAAREPRRFSLFRKRR